MTNVSSAVRVSVVLWLTVWTGQWFCAWSWGPLADEALYWEWGRHLAWGYLDQPPAIAGWAALLSSSHAPSIGVLRLSSVASAAVIAVALSWAAERPAVALLWLAACPPLVILTTFFTPDAGLLACWAMAVAAAIRGGNRWWWVGAAVGIGALHKYTALLLWPLLWAAADPEERRQTSFLGGVAITVLLLIPHAAWLVEHDWQTLRFQAHEGLGLGLDGLGPLRHFGGQALWVTPILALAGWGWAMRSASGTLNRSVGRGVRFAWWTSAPLWLGFGLASLVGQGEVHWTAPAWLSCGLGLACSGARWVRPVYWGSGLGLLLTLMTGIHGTWPLGRLPQDPGTRLTEGDVLSSTVSRWALPVGVAAWDEGSQNGLPVWTERYQEAALIAFHTGLPTYVVPGCGRPTSYAAWPHPQQQEGFFVRPRRSGPPVCAQAWFSELSSQTTIRGMDRHARLAGLWDVFTVKAPVP